MVIKRNGTKQTVDDENSDDDDNNGLYINYIFR